MKLYFFVKLTVVTICLVAMMPIQVHAARDIQSIWSSAIPLLDKYLGKAEAHAELPKKKLFGKDQAANLKEMNALKASILDILLESELVEIWNGIEKLERQIEDAKAEIASLREKRITAPESSRIPLRQDQERIDSRIAGLQARIVESERAIEGIRDRLLVNLQSIGVALSQDQFDAMLSTATSGEIIDIIALSENLKAVVLELVNLMEKTGEDLNIARRYYGLYTVLLEVYIYAHQYFTDKIDTHYLPGISAIKQEADETMKSAQTLMRSLPRDASSDKAVLQANIEANKLTMRVADLYQRILNDQREGINKDKLVLERSLKVAQNTWQTVKISSRMVALVRSGLQEFELLGNMKPLDLRVFANTEMKREFERLTGKLRSVT